MRLERNCHAPLRQSEIGREGLPGLETGGGTTRRPSFGSAHTREQLRDKTKHADRAPPVLRPGVTERLRHDGPLWVNRQKMALDCTRAKGKNATFSPPASHLLSFK